jgi:prepilin-type N-terminal cleavage/methylation domain-containing protein
VSGRTANKGVKYIYSRAARSGRRGFTLPEMLVTMVIITIVAAVAIPTIYAVRDGFASSGAETLISAVISSAKAIAAKEQKYAGVRFQCVPDPENPDEPGDQYIIFIIQDPAMGLDFGFRAAKGIAPIRLPVNQAVLDMTVIRHRAGAQDLPDLEYRLGEDPAENYDNVIYNNDPHLWDMSTFSIVFSPSGRLVTHPVRVRNRDGYPDTPADVGVSLDKVFNKWNTVLPTPPTEPTAMFFQDDCYDGYYPTIPDERRLELGPESSRKNLLIYDKRELRKVAPTARWTGYLQNVSSTGANSEVLYINPYTGTIIENQNLRNAMR